MRPVPVGDHAALVESSGGSAWVRWAVDPVAFPPAWRHPRAAAVAVVRPRRVYPSSLTVVGPPDAAGRLAAALVPEPGGNGPVPLVDGPVVASLTLPRATSLHGYAPLRRLGPGVGWDWMWTDRAPARVPGEDAVTDVDVADPGVAAEVLRLLRSASPRHSAEPGEEQAGRWVGVRGPDGSLLACGACGFERAQVPLLASIAVAEAARNRGLGAAVTAALTRRALADGAPVVTVDLYADNPGARRLYRRLGFTLDQEFTSRQLWDGR